MVRLDVWAFLLVSVVITAALCVSILRWDWSSSSSSSRSRSNVEGFEEEEEEKKPSGLNGPGTGMICSNLSKTLKQAVPICGLDLSSIGLPPKITVNNFATTKGDIHAKGDLTADGDLDVRNPGGKGNHEGGRFHTFYENTSTHASLEEFDDEVSYDLKTHKDGGDVARLVKSRNGDVSIVNDAGHRVRLAKDGGVYVEGGEARVCVNGECLSAGDIAEIHQITSSYVPPDAMEDRIDSMIEEESERRKDRFKELNAKILEGINSAQSSSSASGNFYRKFEEDGTVDLPGGTYEVLMVGGGGGGAWGTDMFGPGGGGSGGEVVMKTVAITAGEHEVKVGRGAGGGGRPSVLKDASGNEVLSAKGGNGGGLGGPGGASAQGNNSETGAGGNIEGVSGNAGMAYTIDGNRFVLGGGGGGGGGDGGNKRMWGNYNYNGANKVRSSESGGAGGEGGGGKGGDHSYYNRSVRQGESGRDGTGGGGGGGGFGNGWKGRTRGGNGLVVLHQVRAA